MAADLKPRFFRSGAEFAAWLAKHHAKSREVLVGFYKTATGRLTLTWSEAVDAALCYGWIDGVRKGLGEERYQIRFTPRKPGSPWSALNVKKGQALIDAGRMRPAGVAAWKARAGPAGYSYEAGASAAFTSDEEKAFRANATAWKDWEGRAPSYRKAVTRWVTSAKQAQTRARRFETLIECSTTQQLVPFMRYGDRK